MSQPTESKQPPIPGTRPWARKRKGSYEYLPPNMSEDLGDKLTQLKAELYKKMDLDDLSQKFGLLRADVGIKMDQRVVRQRLEELSNELNRKIKQQGELKVYVDKVMTQLETVKEETISMKNALDEQMQKLEDMKVELDRQLAQVEKVTHKNRRLAIISLFCVIVAGVFIMFSIDSGSFIPLEISEGIMFFSVCAALVLLGYILGYTRVI